MLRIQLRSMLILFTIIFLASCSPASTPTPFRPPTQIPPTKPLPTVTSLSAIKVLTPTLTITPAPANEGPCVNDLKFLDDLTVKDGEIVTPNSSIDKQWLVQNSGTCNWDSTYRLKWIGGDTLNAAQEQALYPARATTQATLRIIFTAPTTAGAYESAWQAVGPNGNVFGDLIFVKVVAQ